MVVAALSAAFPVIATAPMVGAGTAETRRRRIERADAGPVRAGNDDRHDVTQTSQKSAGQAVHLADLPIEGASRNDAA